VNWSRERDQAPNFMVQDCTLGAGYGRHGSNLMRLATGQLRREQNGSLRLRLAVSRLVSKGLAAISGLATGQP
jgi:hypothetical protein